MCVCVLSLHWFHQASNLRQQYEYDLRLAQQKLEAAILEARQNRERATSERATCASLQAELVKLKRAQRQGGHGWHGFKVGGHGMAWHEPLQFGQL